MLLQQSVSKDHLLKPTFCLDTATYKLMIFSENVDNLYLFYNILVLLLDQNFISLASSHSML